jgi:hypothetical protein
MMFLSPPSPRPGRRLLFAGSRGSLFFLFYKVLRVFRIDEPVPVDLKAFERVA